MQGDRVVLPVLSLDTIRPLAAAATQAMEASESGVLHHHPGCCQGKMNSALTMGSCGTGR